MPKITSQVIATIRTVIEQCKTEESQAKAIMLEGQRPGSILAPFFTQNVAEAAEAWHLHQARQLLMRVRVLIKLEGPGDLHLDVAAFIKTNWKTPGYSARETVVHNDLLKQDTTERFLHDIETLCKRYASYGVPGTNRLIRLVCDALTLTRPLLFDGSTLRVDKQPEETRRPRRRAQAVG